MTAIWSQTRLRPQTLVLAFKLRPDLSQYFG